MVFRGKLTLKLHIPELSSTESFGKTPVNQRFRIDLEKCINLVDSKCSISFSINMLA